MKNVIKAIGKLLLILLVVQILYIPNVQAGFLSNIIDSADDFVNTGKNSGQVQIDKTEVKNAQNEAYNVLLTIGIAASVIIGVILGIKYMVSSVEEQAKVKETLIIYVIGCLVTFGAFGIWRAVVSLISQV